MAVVSALAKAGEPLAVLAGLCQREEPRLGLLDLLVRREVHGAVVGHVHHVLADQDQLAARGEVVDRAPVVARVDDGGGVGSEPAEILRRLSDLASIGSAASKNVLSVIGVACLPVAISLAAVS